MPDDDYYIDLQGRPHETARECIEANQTVEEANSGGYAAGGNCPQKSEDVPDEKGQK